MARPEWIEVGRVSRAHGVHGEVRIVPTSDNPERFLPSSVLYARPGRLGVAGPRLSEQVRLTVSSVRGGEGFPILRFEECAAREAAEALRGYVLEVPSTELPELDEDEYYPFDLVGLEVRDQQGVVVGRVTDVLDSPAHPLLEVTKVGPAASQPAELVPFVHAAVPEVEMAEGYVVIAPGLLSVPQGVEADAPTVDRSDPRSGDQPDLPALGGPGGHRPEDRRSGGDQPGGDQPGDRPRA